MFTSPSNPAKAYAKVGVETGVESASPHKLILMLFDGALMALSTATMHLKEKHIAEKGQALAKAVDIIGNGLKASLDPQSGGDLAGRLEALYDYMCMRLTHANLKNDGAAIAEVGGLLKELRGAWEEIASDSAAVAQNKAAA